MAVIGLEDRFWGKVCYAPALDCWEWLGGKNNHGYGQFSIGGRKGRMHMAHRVAYELLRAEIPQGLHLDHLCRNHSCVNPWHLEPVTAKVNSQRGIVAEVHRTRARLITHCPKGHGYTEKNTGLKQTKTGVSRVCRRCAADYQQRRRNERLVPF